MAAGRSPRSDYYPLASGGQSLAVANVARWNWEPLVSATVVTRIGSQCMLMICDAKEIALRDARDKVHTFAAADLEAVRHHVDASGARIAIGHANAQQAQRQAKQLDWRRYRASRAWNRRQF